MGATRGWAADPDVWKSGKPPRRADSNRGGMKGLRTQPLRLPTCDWPSPGCARAAPRGEAELVIDAQHYHRIVEGGILKAAISLDIMTADFKAMLVPAAG